MNRTATVEKELIKAILQGEYLAGSPIETERELAALCMNWDVLPFAKFYSA